MNTSWFLLGVAFLALVAAVNIFWIRRIAGANRLRQRAEQRLVDMTEKLQTGVFQLKDTRDGLLRTEFKNRRAREMARIPDGSEAEADPFSLFNYIDERDRESVEKRFRACLTTGEDFHETFRFDFPNGQKGWVLADARCRPDDTGGSIWSGYLFDLTSERSLNEKLNRVLIARDDFVAAAGHELRTPIQNVSLALQSINKDLLNEADANRLLAARLAAADLEELVDDFMEISSMTTEAASFRSEPFNLHELIGSICRSFTGTSQAKGLGYEQIVALDVPRVVCGDSLRLKQILYNVIGNAFKYTNTGQVSVQVSSVPAQLQTDGQYVQIDTNDENKAVVEFKVSDTGIGIPATYVADIFEPFATVGPSSRKSSGLGLAICDRLVSLMGGRISVDSQEGSGSTFYVSLPFLVGEACQSEEMDAASATSDLFGDTLSMTQSLNEATWDDDLVASASEFELDRVDTQSNTVIVVDDSFMVRDMLASLLELEGWNVLQADSGTEALAILAEYECRAVITDHKMPNMTGLELGQIMSGLFAERTVRPVMIIMSGGMPTDSIEAANDYFDVVLSKPVRAAEIHQAIMSKSKPRALV